MKQFFLLILLSISISFVHAQDSYISTNPNNSRVEFIQKAQIPNVNEKAEGSRYITEGFSPAIINNSAITYAVRYNAVDDLMELRDENSKILIIDKNKEYIIKFNDGSNKLYQTVTYKDGKRGFAISIWVDENKNGLFIKEKIKFSPEKPKIGYDLANNPAKYARVKDAFYMRDGENSPLKELSSNKKKFLTAFKGKEKKVQNFIKKENLKINNKEDLMKIMLFYFSL